MKSIDLEEIKKKLFLLTQPEEPVEVAIDLHDIYESTILVEKLIKEIQTIKTKYEVIDNLIEVEIELDHINWHYKSLKKELKKLYKLN